MIIQGEFLDKDSNFGTYSSNLIAQGIWSLCNSSKLGAKTRKLLRKKIARKFRGPFDITLEGVNFRLYPSENHCDRTMFSRQKFPEAEEHLVLGKIIGPGMVYVDIGGNIGSYAAYLGKKAEGELQIVAFEPHPITYQKLLFNMRANNLPTEDIVNCGCGPREETLSLWSDGGGNVGQTSLIKEATNEGKVENQVRIRPLLDVLNEKNITKIDVLKIDIEGFEDQAMAPFLRAAPRDLHPRFLLLEFLHHDIWKEDLLELLRSFGYEEYLKTRDNILFKK